MRMRLSLTLFAVVFTVTTAAAQDTAAKEEFFEMRIRPLFANNCYACHTDEHMGGLQLDTAEHALKGGKSGPVIVPGDPDRSLLVKAIHYNDNRLKMPPTGRLKDSEIADVETWIKNGAVWPSTAAAAPAAHSAPYIITAEQRAFWSFRRIANPTPPPVHDKKWARTEIDRFVLAKLEEKNLKPVAAASKRSLIRRAYFDLTGLPPTQAEVAGFEHDNFPNAFAKIVDRLLDSPRYGEKWGRFWLDVARYSDDRLNSERDDPYENSFRYRDWVIQSIQQDMPFNLFVKAQIAGDLLPNHELYEPGLGFYSLSPEFQDDRVDATTRGFMALTVACATCHNHKYDPIPTQDFYSLLGIFNNTELHETPLAPQEEVARWEAQKKLLDTQEGEIKDFIGRQANELAEILAQNTAAYMLASGGKSDNLLLDKETLDRLTKYLAAPNHKHPYLNTWNKEKSAQAAHAFQALLLEINKEKKHIDDENHIRLGLNPSRENLSDANLASMPRDKYVLWEDFFGDKGVFHYGDGAIDRFLTGVWKTHLDSLRARQAELKNQLPPRYAYLQTIADKKKLDEARVWLRGNKDNPGEPAPPHFLAILSEGAPPKFAHGNGRLDLAEAIVDPKNPLTARVIVNRVWQQHFGQGIVRTPSNFGKQGDTPSHPELLDYLAARFMAEGWSLKKLHREMMLTAAYALSTQNDETNLAADPENRLLWRANRRRLDVESIRDSLLFVAGDLDLKTGGPATAFGPDNHRRTVYGFVSRRRLDPILALFDFPNPIATSEQRLPTLVPLQKLFFMNSDFVMEQSKALAKKLQESAGDENARITSAYRLLFQREPSAEERKLAIDFLHGTSNAWPQYTQVLLSSNEFSYLN